MDWLCDDRTDCYSVLTTMRIRDYLQLVKTAHSIRGALSGQRDTLKTTTAKRIRDRMVSDIRRGAVLPPVVLGAVVDKDTFATYPRTDIQTPADILPQETRRQIAIIDGMQRTAALQEAVDADAEVLEREMRVEFWITRTVRTMIYRMLVLNTGQVPWTISRQLSVVYAPLLEEIKNNVPELRRIFTPDVPGRRVAPGEFGSDAVVELYIAFSLRKTTIDTREALSDEFSRLDFVDNLSEAAFQEQFYQTLGLLACLDEVFARYDSGGGGRFAKGRNIFDAQPARIGFIVAVALHVLGRPGMDRDARQRAQRMERTLEEGHTLIDRLGALSNEELGEFLKLDVLTEIVDRRVGQVGRYERGVFFEAFQVMVSEGFVLDTLEPCWRAN